MKKLFLAIFLMMLFTVPTIAGDNDMKSAPCGATSSNPCADFVTKGPWVDVRSQGVLCDNSTNDYVNLQKVATLIQNAGGGTIVFPANKTCSFVSINSQALFNFSNLNGVMIIAPGTTLKDNRTYALGENSTLFNFTNVSNVNIPNINVVTENYSSFPDTRGLESFYLTDNTTTAGSNIFINANVSGGKSVVHFIATTRGNATLKYKNVNINLVADHVEYPFLNESGADDVTANLITNFTGRGFFIWGVHSQKISIHDKNLQGANEIAAYTGLGVEDLEVWYYNKETTSYPVAHNPFLILQWSDTSSANFTNLKFHLDTINSNANTFGFMHPDSAVGGHGDSLNGFYLDGYSKGTGYGLFTTSAGLFGTTDKQSNVTIQNLIVEEDANSQLDLPNLQNPALIINVKDTVRFLTPTLGTSKVVVINSSATRFENATGDTDFIDYIDSSIGDSNPALANKNFFQTKINGVVTNSFLNQIQSILATGTAPLSIASITPVPNLGVQNVWGPTNQLLFTTTASVYSTSGFGPGASISSSNGSAVFALTTGTGNTWNSGTVTMPTAATGWFCQVVDQSTISSTNNLTKQTANSTNSVTVASFSDISIAGAWTGGDVLLFNCHAY